MGMLPSVLWCCWLGGRKGIRPVKKLEWWGAGVVNCLERGADLHMAQLMPLPLTVSCFSKIQIGFAFLVPAHLGSPGQRAVKQVCVCVCKIWGCYLSHHGWHLWSRPQQQVQQQWHSNITNMNRSTLTATWVSWNTYIFFLQCSGKITMGISGTVFTSQMPFLSLYKTQSTDPRSVTNLFFTYHSTLARRCILHSSTRFQ